ncbi:MAG: hypothetical protein ACRDGD_05200 [Candidatus Limnocylindria bacterium]
MAKAKAKAEPKAEPKAKATTTDPDKLQREQAGTYRTADDRFEVREAGTGWFLVDTEQANEFGQELVLGPFATLKAVRDAIPDARSKPMRPRPTPKRPKSKARAATEKAETPPPPPPSWIDKLSRTDATAVRNQIHALERQGIDGAEDLVRKDREGLMPAVSARLIERRLEALVEEAPPKERARARKLVRGVVNVLSADAARGDLPGWALVEIGPEPDPPNRRIQPDLRE